VSSLLRRVVQTRPHALATVFKSRRQNWTALRARVARLAEAISETRLKPNDRIALLRTKRPLCRGYVASGWAGGVITPLNGRWSIAELTDRRRRQHTALACRDDAHLQTAIESPRSQSNRTDAHTCSFGDDACPSGLDPMSRSTKKVRSRMRGPQRRRFCLPFSTRRPTGRSKGVIAQPANMVASVVQSLAENHFAETRVYLNTLPTFHLSSMWPFHFLRGQRRRPRIVLPGFDPESCSECHRGRESH